MSTLENPDSDDLPMMIEDTRLRGRYSVLDVATLAAGCRGRSPRKRIEEAIQLLSAAEWSALASKEAKEREIIRERAAARGESLSLKGIKSRQATLSMARDKLHEWKRIVAKAERDNETQKILRSSLVIAIFQAEKRQVKNVDHANRLFNDWLKYERNLMQNEEPDVVLVSLEEHRLHYASQVQKKWLVHDDETAELIAVGISSWIEGQKAVPRKPSIRARKGGTIGQFVPKATRGAGRRVDGKYSK